MTKREAEYMFKRINAVRSAKAERDFPKLRIQWSYYLDCLFRSGDISEKQVSTWTLPTFIK